MNRGTGDHNRAYVLVGEHTIENFDTCVYLGSVLSGDGVVEIDAAVRIKQQRYSERCTEL